MKARYLWVSLLLTVFFVLPACTKKEEEKPTAKAEQAAPAQEQTQQATTMPAQEGMASGKDVYEKSCAACHASGVSGAPKVGDMEAWKDRIAQGMDALYEHSITGFQGTMGVMPPKGGDSSLTDDQVKAAVDYMVEESK